MLGTRPQGGMAFLLCGAGDAQDARLRLLLLLADIDRTSQQVRDATGTLEQVAGMLVA